MQTKALYIREAVSFCGKIGKIQQDRFVQEFQISGSFRLLYRKFHVISRVESLYPTWRSKSTVSMIT